MPTWKGHFRTCVFTRNCVTPGGEVLRDKRLWEKVWETKRKKVELLYRLEQCGHLI